MPNLSEEQLSPIIEKYCNKAKKYVIWTLIRVSMRERSMMKIWSSLLGLQFVLYVLHLMTFI